MSFFDIRYLVSVLIGIDIIFILFLIILLNRMRYFNKKSMLGKEIKTFELLVKDADKTAANFNEQLKEKTHFIKRLNAKLDRRISRLNMLINRSDIILSHTVSTDATDNIADKDLSSRQTEIMNLAKNGYSIEDIAQKLSIQRGEVTLVLKIK